MIPRDLPIYHVYPEDDLKDHVLEGEKCWCRPESDEDEDCLVIIHNSLDRREEYEKSIH